MRHRLEYVLFQSFKWLVLLLPHKSAQRLGYAIGAGAYHIAGSRREIALDNLRHAFPEKSEQEIVGIAKGAFRNYGIMFVDLLWVPNLTPEFFNKIITKEAFSLATDTYQKGKGVIFLSGHFGSWEMGGLSIGFLMQKPVFIVVQEQSNKLVDIIVNKHRCKFGNKVVPLGMSVREILRVLDNKEPIALAADQSAAKERIHINFFGRNVATHEGPAVFSLRSGTPILMIFVIRNPDLSYRVVLESVPLNDLPKDKEEAVIELTKRHTAILEQYIRNYPDQWLWMHRRWKYVEESAPPAIV